MSNDSTRKQIALPIKIGIALTIALIGFIWYLGAIYRCSLHLSGALECRYNFEWLIDSPPNEIGDTIAGVFATLAFVWIVVTVFLQSAELSEQREELKLTREELRLSRQAQEKQVEAAQIQAEIFKDEKLSRDQARNFSEVQALAEEIFRQATGEAVGSASWEFEKPNGSGGIFRDTYFLINFREYKRESRLDAVSTKLAVSINEAHIKVSKKLKEGFELIQVPSLSEALHGILKMIVRIDKLFEGLSEADKVRLASFELEAVRSAIEEIENHPEYWVIWGNGSQT